MIKKEHAKFSPSKRHRWSRCPGSIREEAKYPDIRSEAAIDGTHSHTLLQKCGENGLIDPTLFIGIKFTDEDGEFVVDRERAERVKVAIDYLKERLDEFDWHKIDFESRYSHIGAREDLSGTTDIVIYWEKNSHFGIDVIDYKDGFGEVEVKGNLQLEQYLLGHIVKCALSESLLFCRMTIIQPKMVKFGKIAIAHDEYEYSTLDLDKKGANLLEQVELAEKEDAPLIAGEIQCKFCKAKGACSAYAKFSTESVGIDISNLDIPTTPISELSNDKLSDILENAGMLKAWIESVESEVYRRLNEGQDIPGFKLIEGRRSRSWAKEDDEMVKKLVKMGVPKKELFVTKLVSPNQLKSVTWVKKDGTTGQLSNHQLEVIEKDYVVRLPGKPVIAKEKDDRESLNSEILNLFKGENNV